MTDTTIEDPRRDDVDDEPREPDEGWSARDVWLGSLFLAAGALLVAFATVADPALTPAQVTAAAWILGPILVLLGLNGVVRSLHAWWKRARRDGGLGA